MKLTKLSRSTKEGPVKEWYHGVKFVKENGRYTHLEKYASREPIEDSYSYESAADYYYRKEEGTIPISKTTYFKIKKQGMRKKVREYLKYVWSGGREWMVH